MKILFVEHASFEKPGYIEHWAKKNGHSTHTVNPYLGEHLPGIDEFDFLVVMGGPQSSLELVKYAYLYDEIDLIKQAILSNKRILGVCLGAQLITEALGAKSERSPYREIGMFDIELLNDAKKDPVFKYFPEKFGMMHWHSDMPGKATGVVWLAKSEGCPRQAFRYGDRIYGFQCHFELTADLVKGVVAHCLSDLTQGGPFIRSAKELLEADYADIHSKMELILNYLANLSD